MKTLFTFLLLFMLLNSCVSYQSGGLNSSSAGTNYVYTDIAIGEARANRVFNLGGMNKDALLLEAKRQMITSRPLQANEEYINFTFDVKRSFILWLDRTKVTVSADVILHTNSTPEERFTENYKAKVFLASKSDTLFQIGDSVRTEKGISGIILQNYATNKCKVLYKNEKGALKTKQINKALLYNLRGNWKDFEVGDEIKYTEKFETLPFTGTIIGIGQAHLLFRTSSGDVYRTPYKRIQPL